LPRQPSPAPGLTAAPFHTQTAAPAAAPCSAGRKDCSTHRHGPSSAVHMTWQQQQRHLASKRCCAPLHPCRSKRQGGNKQQHTDCAHGCGLQVAHTGRHHSITYVMMTSLTCARGIQQAASNRRASTRKAVPHMLCCCGGAGGGGWRCAHIAAVQHKPPWHHCCLSSADLLVRNWIALLLLRLLHSADITCRLLRGAASSLLAV
jgi:hypothetical protein